MLNETKKEYPFEGNSEIVKIIRELAEENDVPIRKTGRLIYDFIDKIVERTERDGELAIRKFGRFVLWERHFYSPITGENEVATSMKFMPSNKLRKHLSNKEGD